MKSEAPKSQKTNTKKWNPKSWKIEHWKLKNVIPKRKVSKTESWSAGKGRTKSRNLKGYKMVHQKPNTKDQK